MRTWSLAFGLAACTPGSSWQQAQAVCGFAPAPLDVASLAHPPAYPSRACVDTVLGDFGLDRATVLSADADTDPYALVGSSIDDQSRTTDLLWAAHALLASDLGSLSDVRGVWATDPFRATLSRIGRVSGQDAVGPLLYDYVTDRVRRTTVEPLDAAAGMRGRTLVLQELPVGIAGAAVLVHEARHSEGLVHVSCGGARICDVDATGALGFELAVHELARDAAADVVVEEIATIQIEALGGLVLSR